MKTTPLTLLPHELCALGESQTILIARPVRPQPRRHGQEGHKGHRHIVTAFRTGSRVVLESTHFIGPRADDSQSIRCALGAIGERRWVREVWGVGSRPDPVDGCVDGFEYRADEQGRNFDEIEGLPLYTPKLPDEADLSIYEGKGWQAASRMPQWASRYTVAIEHVEVRRVQAITEIEALAMGVAEVFPSIGKDDDARSLVETDRFFDELAVWVEWSKKLDPAATGGTALGAFACIWRRDHGDAAWDDNEWIWLARASRVDGKEQG